MNYEEIAKSFEKDQIKNRSKRSDRRRKITRFFTLFPVLERKNHINLTSKIMEKQEQLFLN